MRDIISVFRSDWIPEVLSLPGRGDRVRSPTGGKVQVSLVSFVPGISAFVVAGHHLEAAGAGMPAGHCTAWFVRLADEAENIFA